jgi:hypothetical protein
MKLIIAAGFISLVMGSSCRKDFVCRCSKTYTTGTGDPVSEYSSYTFKEKRKNAEEHCNAYATTGTDTYGTYAITCQIQ